MRRIAALATILTLGATACGGDGDLSTRLAMRPLGGVVEVRDGGSWELVSDETMIALGSEIRTGDDGWAMVELPRDQTVELAPGTSLAVTQTTTSKLKTGSVLVRAPSAVGIQLQDAEVRGVGGTFRVDRDFQDLVRVYEGVVTIPGSGWEGEVTSLREVTVVAGSVPRAPQPVSLDEPIHRWEERLFQGAIEIGLSLERLEKGLDRQFPSKRVRDVVAGVTPRPVPVRMVRGQLSARPLWQWSEVMVAAVLASRTEADAPVEDALLRVLALRDLGASWIVIAAELGITETVLAAIGRVSGLLARVVEEFLSAPSGPGSGGGPGASPGGSPSVPVDDDPNDGPNGDPNDGPNDDPNDGGDGGGGTDPPPDPEPSPDPPCALGGLICGVGEETLGGDLPGALDI